MITAKVIADSTNEFGNRITTMIVTFPRIILAENNTHRMISKNSASSRAIPYRKMVETMFGKDNLRFTPVAWQKDHSGMQGHEYFTDPVDISECQEIWDEAAKNALMSSEKLSNKGVTKQLCNRLLEPFMWQTVIVTGTEWANFFHLRCPQYAIQITGTPDPVNFEPTIFRSRKDMIKTAPVLEGQSDLDFRLLNKGMAEIHMMDLAEVMWDAFNESTPKELKAGEWHIPFGDNIDVQKLYHTIENPSGGTIKWKPIPGVDEGAAEFYEKEKVKIATARCARVSYTVVGEEGKPDNYENDIKLHDRLSKSGHWSPFEHCAQAMGNNRAGFVGGEEQGHLSWSGNFQGFIQYRKTFSGENVTK